MFVLVGQILNSRGRFGPMMWAPIANNVISVAVLVVYLVAFGAARGDEATGAFSSDQELLLGIGSTVGIAAQLLILVPYLQVGGLHLPPPLRLPRHRSRPHVQARRLDRAVRGRQPDRLHGRGPARPRAAPTGGSVDGHRLHGLLRGVPDRDGAARGDHGLAGHRDPAAALAAGRRRRARRPRAHAGLDPAHRADRRRTVRRPAARSSRPTSPTWSGATAAGRLTYDNTVPTLSLFGAGIVFFTVHYLMLRGFYALEQTRTVFLIQCAVGGHQHRRRARAGRAQPTTSTPRRRWCSPTPRRTSSARSCPTPCCGDGSAAWRRRRWSASSWCC